MEWCEERVTVSIIPEDSTGNANGNEICYEKCEIVTHDDIVGADELDKEILNEVVTYAIVTDGVEIVEETVLTNENFSSEMPLPSFPAYPVVHNELESKDSPAQISIYLTE